MATRKKTTAPDPGKRELIKGKENLLIEKEKRYQREDRKPQVEKLTTLKETKKRPAAKAKLKKK